MSPCQRDPPKAAWRSVPGCGCRHRINHSAWPPGSLHPQPGDGALSVPHPLMRLCQALRGPGERRLWSGLSCYHVLWKQRALFSSSFFPWSAYLSSFWCLMLHFSHGHTQSSNNGEGPSSIAHQVSENLIASQMLGPGSKTSRKRLLRIWSAFLFPTKFTSVLEVIAKAYLWRGLVFSLSWGNRQLIIQMQKCSLIGTSFFLLFVLKLIVAGVIHELW